MTTEKYNNDSTEVFSKPSSRNPFIFIPFIIYFIYIMIETYNSQNKDKFEIVAFFLIMILLMFLILFAHFKSFHTFKIKNDILMATNDLFNKEIMINFSEIISIKSGFSTVTIKTKKHSIYIFNTISNFENLINEIIVRAVNVKEINLLSLKKRGYNLVKYKERNWRIKS